MKKTIDEQIIKHARGILDVEIGGLQRLSAQLNEKNLGPVLDLILNCPGHILTTGAGTSRAVAERFAHLLACCGIPALYISGSDALHGGSGALKSEDVVYIISKGGQSAELNQFAHIAHQRGAKIIAQTEKPESPLGKLADAIYHVVALGDVDPYGMIATGSSLVNSAACDVLCILLLEMTGYSKEKFAETHPGGAVGVKISESKK